MTSATLATMASRINFYSELAVSLIRISDIELGDFKKVQVNGGTDNDSLKDSHKCLLRWQTRIIW